LLDQEAAFGLSGSRKGCEEEKVARDDENKPVENLKESKDNLILLSLVNFKDSFLQIDLIARLLS